MGHLGKAYGVYGKLRERLDMFPIGAPESKEIYEILKILYTEQEAEVASKMPLRFASLRRISSITKIPPAELEPILEGMAEKGLVMDFEKGGKKYYILSPTLIGFFEFTFMRVTDRVPQKELASLMRKYVHENAETARGVIGGGFPPARTLVHEDALEKSGYSTEVLDFETATHLLGEAWKVGVGMCYCRHIAAHEGKACEKPVEVCMSLNRGADYLTRRGFMREVSKEEARDILQKSREEGLVFTADNVKSRPTFICHCCGCCCGILGAYKNFRMENSLATSHYLASVNAEKCSGCGLCVKKCQVDAIGVVEKEGKKFAVVDLERCIGCGVCVKACNRDALKMVKNGKRIITPESAMEKYLLMALDQGKLGNFIFDDMTSLTHRTLRAFVNAAVRLEPVKNYLKREDVRSRFLKKVAG
ncbi:MAG: 4Fe-4S dicluster domain-containing protein [Deltaproteobacteria bacterium]|nr:MAG: 4Fe-4S dicluster domain-containing protein [Deltaproteobacteria bacterium]